MKRESRLNQRGPSEEQYSADQVRVEAEVNARYPDAEWSALIAPLTALVQELAAGRTGMKAPPSPAQFAPDLAEAWKELTQALLVNEPRGLHEKAGAVLVNRLGAALARSPEGGPASWFRTSQALDRGGASFPFLEHLEPEVLLAHEQELQALPTYGNPLEFVNTFGRLHEPESQRAYLEEVAERARSAPDRWTWLEEVERDADVCTFQEPLGLQAHLLGRIGGKSWLRFVQALPLTLLREIAVRELQSPDEALDLVGLTLDEAVAGESPHEELLTLLVRRTFEIWNRIHASLVHWASGRSFLTSEHPEYLARAVAAEKDWKERELPDRARTLAARLLRDGREMGFRIATMASRHLFARSFNPQNPPPEKETTPVIRDALVEALAKSGRSLAEVVGGLLEPRLTKPGLLSACQVVLDKTVSFSEQERDEQSTRLWVAYGSQLQNDHYFLNGPLVEDDKHLAEALGGILARLSGPEDAFQKMFESIWRPSEGWKADHEAFLESLHNLAHLLIVGAIASHWLKQQDADGQTLFRLVWKRLHSWLRTLPEPLCDDEARSAIVHVWGRLWLIEGPAALNRAQIELQRLDRLNWLLIAAGHLLRNQIAAGGPSLLDLKLQQVLWTRFEKMFSVFRLRHTVTPELAARYEETAVQLTPDVPHPPRTPQH